MERPAAAAVMLEDSFKCFDAAARSKEIRQSERPAVENPISSPFLWAYRTVISLNLNLCRRQRQRL